MTSLPNSLVKCSVYTHFLQGWQTALRGSVPFKPELPHLKLYFKSSLSRGDLVEWKCIATEMFLLSCLCPTQQNSLCTPLEGLGTRFVFMSFLTEHAPWRTDKPTQESGCAICWTLSHFTNLIFMTYQTDVASVCKVSYTSCKQH